MKFLLRIGVNAVALFAATKLINGIQFTGTWWQLLCVALAFGILNAVVRPFLNVLSLPVMILTLGLFTFVINALMLYLTSAISGKMGLGFHVDGFVPALLGAIVVSLVSVVLNRVVPD